MTSSLFNVTVQKAQALQVRLDDEADNPVAIATARGVQWLVEILRPIPATFVINSYLSEAKMTEILQALMVGYQDLYEQGWAAMK